MIGISFLFILVGLILTGALGVLPTNMQTGIPDIFRFIMFAFGIILAIAGFMLIVIRANKTGAIHLLRAGRPDLLLWFYVFRDNEIMITPSMRTGEGQLYNKQLDSQIPDVKTYTMADHKIRIVPEVVGHAVDLDYVMYVNLMKTKFGVQSLREARKKLIEKALETIGITKDNEIPLPQERALAGGDIDKRIREDIRKEGRFFIPKEQ